MNATKQQQQSIYLFMKNELFLHAVSAVLTLALALVSLTPSSAALLTRTALSLAETE